MNYNKYKNVKTYIDGFKFDSKAESERYLELKLLEKSGAISNLRLQPRYEVQAKFRHNGKAEQAISYVADFEYIDPKESKIIVEDVKGMETQVFKIKRKLFLNKYRETHELKVI